MWKSFPKVIILDEEVKAKQNFTFWLEDGNMLNLYRVEEDIPENLTSLPSLSYRSEEKESHMLDFLEREKVEYMVQNGVIYIINETKKDYVDIEAPLYKRVGDNCEFVQSKFSRKYPTKEFIHASFQIFEAVYKKIRTEEILYDFYRLSLDCGISAFMEDYRPPLSYLDENIFYIHNIGNNPNDGEEPFNEYSKTYLDYSKGPIMPLQNCIVFNRLAIKKAMESDEFDPATGIHCKLPQKVAGLAIGKNGATVARLACGIGVPRITFDIVPETEKSIS